jgi:hypothetical protein
VAWSDSDNDDDGRAAGKEAGGSKDKGKKQAGKKGKKTAEEEAEEKRKEAELEMLLMDDQALRWGQGRGCVRLLKSASWHGRQLLAAGRQLNVGSMGAHNPACQPQHMSSCKRELSVQVLGAG